MKYKDVLKEINFRKDMPVKKLGSNLDGSQKGRDNQAYMQAELGESPSSGNKNLPEGTRQPNMNLDAIPPSPSAEMQGEIDNIINGSMRDDALLRSLANQIVHYSPLENPRDTYRRAMWETIKSYPDIFKRRELTKLQAQAGGRW